MTGWREASDFSCFFDKTHELPGQVGLLQQPRPRRQRAFAPGFQVQGGQGRENQTVPDPVELPQRGRRRQHFQKRFQLACMRIGGLRVSYPKSILALDGAGG